MYRFYNNVFRHGDHEPVVALEKKDIAYFNKLIKNKCYDEYFQNSIHIQDEIIYKQPTLETIEILVEHKFPLDTMLNQAAWYGNREIIMYLLTKGATPSKKILQTACEAGHLSISQYLVSIGCDPKDVNMSIVAQRGQLEIIKWLHSLGCPLPLTATKDAIVANNHILCKWFIEQGCYIHSSVLTTACKDGDLEKIKWLYSIQPKKVYDYLESMVQACCSISLAHHYGAGGHRVYWSKGNLVEIKDYKDHLACFTFLFEIAPDKQAFWNMKFECPFIRYIDLSLDVWQPVLELDLHLREYFEAIIEDYKKKNMLQPSENVEHIEPVNHNNVKLEA